MHLAHCGMHLDSSSEETYSVLESVPRAAVLIETYTALYTLLARSDTL